MLLVGGAPMLNILEVALIALGLSANCSAIIIFKLNRHQRAQQASFEESLFEIDYHLGRMRRGDRSTLISHAIRHAGSVRLPECRSMSV